MDGKRLMKREYTLELYFKESYLEEDLLLIDRLIIIDLRAFIETNNIGPMTADRAINITRS